MMDEDDGYFMAGSNIFFQSNIGEEKVMIDATSHNSNNSQEEEATVENNKRSKLHKKGYGIMMPIAHGRPTNIIGLERLNYFLPL